MGGGFLFSYRRSVMLDLTKPMRRKGANYPARYVATLEGRKGIIMAYQIPCRDYETPAWTARTYSNMDEVNIMFENVPPPKVKVDCYLFRYVASPHTVFVVVGERAAEHVKCQRLSYSFV